jgi:hypothetical protein
MIRAKVNSRMVINMLRNADPDANAAVMLAVGAMGVEAKALCTKMLTSLGDDHSLAELAKMGHPYGRGVTTNLGGGREVDRSPIPHSPMEQVHNRNDELVNGLTLDRPVAHHGAITSTLHNTAQPLDSRIQSGTRVMVARPYMRYVRDTYHKVIESVGIKMIAAWARKFGRSGSQGIGLGRIDAGNA